MRVVEDTTQRFQGELLRGRSKTDLPKKVDSQCEPFFGRSADHRLVEEAGGCRPKPFVGRSAENAERRRERMAVLVCRYMALTSPPRQ